MTSREFPMYTRRNALLATTAFALGAGRKAAAEPAQLGKPASEVDGCNHREVQLCLELAEMAGDCIRSTALKSNSSLPDFILVCQDVERICCVTATTLNQRSRTAPAICQACADACDRLANVCATIDLNGQESRCQELAVRCGNACLAMIQTSVA